VKVYGLPHKMLNVVASATASLHQSWQWVTF